MKIVSIGPQATRAICFLAHGQRCEQWLPAGEYIVGEEVWLSVTSDIRAVTLFETRRHGTTWYVNPQFIRRETAQ